MNYFRKKLYIFKNGKYIASLLEKEESNEIKKLVAIMDINTGENMAEIEYGKKIQNFTEVFI